MLDPITASGLVGNVLQFVQFGAQLVALTREIHTRGVPTYLENLRRVTSILTEQAEDVKSHLEQAEIHQTLSGNDKVATCLAANGND
jgi:hypothetical protein